MDCSGNCRGNIPYPQFLPVDAGFDRSLCSKLVCSLAAAIEEIWLCTLSSKRPMPVDEAERLMSIQRVMNSWVHVPDDSHRGLIDNPCPSMVFYDAKGLTGSEV